MPSIESNTNILNTPLNQLSSEADVENKFIIPLFRELGLIRTQEDYKLRVPVPIYAGRQSVTKQADIVIYKEDKPKYN